MDNNEKNVEPQTSEVVKPEAEKVVEVNSEPMSKILTPEEKQQLIDQVVGKQPTSTATTEQKEKVVLSKEEKQVIIDNIINDKNSSAHSSNANTTTSSNSAQQTKPVTDSKEKNANTAFILSIIALVFSLLFMQIPILWFASVVLGIVSLCMVCTSGSHTKLFAATLTMSIVALALDAIIVFGQSIINLF